LARAAGSVVTLAAWLRRFQLLGRHFAGRIDEFFVVFDLAGRQVETDGRTLLFAELDKFKNNFVIIASGKPHVPAAPICSRDYCDDLNICFHNKTVGQVAFDQRGRRQRHPVAGLRRFKRHIDAGIAGTAAGVDPGHAGRRQPFGPGGRVAARIVARVRMDQGVVAQVGRLVQGLAQQQRGAAHGEHAGVHPVPRMQAGTLAGTIAQRQVDRARFEVGQVVVDIDVHLPLRKGGLEGRQARRQPLGRQRLHRADGDDSAAAVGGRVERRFEADEQVLERASQRRPGRGELHRPVQAHEQRLAHVLLEAAHLVADGGGRDVQFIGCFEEALVARGRFEAARGDQWRVVPGGHAKSCSGRCRNGNSDKFYSSGSQKLSFVGGWRRS
jgi:hypothetical protein